MSEGIKTILLLGASGRTGRLVLARALSQGYAVVALVRDPASLTAATNLTTVEGSPLDIDAVRRAAQSGPTKPLAIVSTLGQRRKSDNPWSALLSPPDFMTKATQNAIMVAKETGIAKLVIMSLFGAGQSWKNNNFIIRLVFKHSKMWHTIEDANAVDQAVKSSGLNFVLIRSTALMGTAEGEAKDLGDDGERAGFMPSISPQVVARTLIEAVEGSVWDGRTPVISL